MQKDRGKWHEESLRVFFFGDLDLEKQELQVICVPTPLNTDLNTCTNFMAVFSITSSYLG